MCDVNPHAPLRGTHGDRFRHKPFQQIAHMVVACAPRGSAHYNCDDVFVVAPNRCGEVETGCPGITRFDAVYTADVTQQAVVIAITASGICITACREI